MLEKVSYRIDNEGRFYREILRSDEIEVTDAVAKAFQTAQLLAMPNVATIKTSDGVQYVAHVKYDVNSSMAYWTVPISTIMLTTAFHTVGEGAKAMLVPKFGYNQSDPGEVVMSIPWGVVPDTETGYAPKILLVVSVHVGNMTSAKQYLFAFDRRGNAYRMPMSNLYATCELCAGEFDRHGGSQIECVTNALEQFRKGAWNSDLWDAGRDKAASEMFRFRPLKDGFETLLIHGKWVEKCEKVSTPTIKFATV